MNANRIPVILVFLLAAAGVVGLGFVLVSNRSDNVPVSNNQPSEPERGALTLKEYVARVRAMDDDKNEVISLDEFTAHYGEKAKFILHKGEGQPEMSAPEAFSYFDHDGSGLVDFLDYQFFDNVENQKLIQKTEAKGLTLKGYFGLNLELNGSQLTWAETELGAARLHTVPFGGQFFAAKYFKPWAAVTKTTGERVEGFAMIGDGSDAAKAEHLADGDVKLLTLGAKLLFISHGQIKEIQPLPENPYNVYLREITNPSLKPEDKAANLALARKFAKDGPKDEAVIFYRRVLILERDNAEALQALGLKLDGNEYKAR